MSSSSVSLNFLACCRLVALVVFALVTLPLVLLFKLILPWFWWVAPPFFHRVICWILGIHITVRGERLRGKSVLFVSNHISWKDIFILGAVIKKASFISKAEVGSVSFVRKIVDLQKTIYVKRERRTDAKKQSEEMAARIAAGDSLILFPEGTTTRGVHVNRFKSTLFSVAEMIIRSGQASVTVQPVTLSFTHANNLPILRAERIRIGWIGQEGFWPHFKHALLRRSTYVSVEFHSPIVCDDQINRKELAATCEGVIREGLALTHRKVNPKG